MSSAPSSGLPPNIGAITSATLIGSLLNFFLFGTLVIQVYVYNICFPKDTPTIKRLVHLVFLAMAVCTCLNAADAHYWYAAGFGDLAKFSQARFSPFYTPIMGSIIALVVQLFYCYRISLFRSNTVWFTAIIALASLVQAVGGIGGGVKAYIAANEQHDQARTVLVYVCPMWLVGDAVADILIAITMTHLLAKASDPQTRHLVRGVVRLIIETNTFSASVALVGLVLFAGLPTADYFICPTMILPGIYANTLLVVLNNRARPSSPYAHPDADDMYVSDSSTTARGSNNTRVFGSNSIRALDNVDGSNDSNVGFNLGPFIAAPNNRGSALAPLEPFAAVPGRERGEVSWGSLTDLDIEDDERPQDSKWM
ncbi:hypothetical protein C8R44DRAFT_986985 [Mycena epipterygia]|nr:hypothetical protein C8R44DRAFT_986985 [Mycena epipterygia]